jgi:hypothetical protein
MSNWKKLTKTIKSLEIDYSEKLIKSIINKENGGALKLLYQIKLCLNKTINTVSIDMSLTNKNKTLISRDKLDNTYKNGRNLLTKKEYAMQQHMVKYEKIGK